MPTSTAALSSLLLILLLRGLAAAALDGPDDGATPRPGGPLPLAWITRLASLALAGIAREYPNKPSNVLGGPADLLPPRARHPAFYGCFDWHSAVHGHWCLVRLLKVAPTWQEGRAEIRSALEGNLTADNLQTEAAWFDVPAHHGFERTYGWAWLLRLAQELRTWDDDGGRAWAAHLRPLETRIVERARAWLPKLPHPLRTGEHGNTAFALALFIDHARATGNAPLEQLCVERARKYYLDDTAWPVAYEPSGHDFFSPGLAEADLMRRVLAGPAWTHWLRDFLPGLWTQDLGPLATPTAAADVTDGRLVHLAGLDLTRAWMLRTIGLGLAEADDARPWLVERATAHARAGLGQVFSGDYAGEHWLASFAVFLLTDADLPTAPAGTAGSALR